MKYSRLFGKTTYGEQKGSEMISHQLLLRGGYIRESVAGRYFFLPLGMRVHDKIKAIIKEEMDATGAQEMISPVLHPLELWQETNRTNTTGFELMKVKDRRGAEFALGGTAEEMFVDVVRKFNLSYRDLPINIYQFSTKFRDEQRARGGLLRVREFVMKDGYSFHTGVDDFKREYDIMGKTYTKIFERMGLTAIPVEADNGYIGGEYCHEYQVVHPEGEGRFFQSEDGKYVAHVDIAKIEKRVEVGNRQRDEQLQMKEVEAMRGNTMEDGVKLHGVALPHHIKSVMYVDNNGRKIVAAIRGDLQVNETKLQHVTGGIPLRAATNEEIEALGTVAGFIGPVKLSGVTLVADDSLVDSVDMCTGANTKHHDLLHVCYGRDWKAEIEADITEAFDGAIGPTGSVLREKRGIEVGNIFQLGQHYTNLMKNAVFVDKDGSLKPYYMGCYGIGLGRTLATIVEMYHDDKGIMWPASVAPYQVHLVSLRGAEERAEQVYKQLQQLGVEVLWDERDVSPGVKFADADLLGMPVRLVVSPRTGENVEFKLRTEKEAATISFDEAIERIKNINPSSR